MKYLLPERSVNNFLNAYFLMRKQLDMFNKKIIFYKFLLKLCVAFCISAGFIDAAYALDGSLTRSHSTLVITILVGVSAYAFYMGQQYFRQKHALNEERSNRSLSTQILSSRLNRVERALGQSNTVFLIWTGRSAVAEVIGNVHVINDLPKDVLQIPKWKWLQEHAKEELSANISQLRAIGQEFEIYVSTVNSDKVLINGSALGSDVILTLQPVSNHAKDTNQLVSTHNNVQNQIITGHHTRHIPQFFEMSVYPSWVRNENGALCWVNIAYVEAVESSSIERVIAEQTELLDENARKLITHDINKKGQFRGRLSGVSGANRSSFEVFETKNNGYTQGFAVNITAYMTGTQDLERQLIAHKNTLAHLPIAVAIFNGAKELVFYNDAFEKLWGLDVNFMAEKPSESRVLDALREKNLLPEQADFKKWKAQHLQIYLSSKIKEELWYSPKGQTIHMIANPNPAGGVIYFYEDVTKQISIETQYNSLMQLQHETLEALTEGVAVFGSNGRLRLLNPAFLLQWGLDNKQIRNDMRVDEVFTLCKPALEDKTVWSMIKGHITTINQQRYAVQGQVECKNGTVLDWSTLPLPDGGTLLKFSDVTAAAQMQRSLAERNEALEAAQQLKNNFIQHISYQLRSPLTNVIGFADLMQSKSAGKLSKKQLEYMGYITASSSALLNIINDILDLATIDAGVMSLELIDVEPTQVISQAVTALNAEFEAKKIGLTVNIPSKIGKFEADTRRLHQIFTNLIGNAINFSQQGQMVSITAKKSIDVIQFVISDQGCGIPPESISHVFDRFVSHQKNTDNSVGLGLSIAKAFVELHNGTISITSELNKGTTIECTFPIRQHAFKTIEHSVTENSGIQKTPQTKSTA